MTLQEKFKQDAIEASNKGEHDKAIELAESAHLSADEYFSLSKLWPSDTVARGWYSLADNNLRYASHLSKAERRDIADEWMKAALDNGGYYWIIKYFHCTSRVDGPLPPEYSLRMKMCAEHAANNGKYDMALRFAGFSDLPLEEFRSLMKEWAFDAVKKRDYNMAIRLAKETWPEVEAMILQMEV